MTGRRSDAGLSSLDDERDEALRAVLAGAPLAQTLLAVVESIERRRPGHRALVAARVGAGRVVTHHRGAPAEAVRAVEDAAAAQRAEFPAATLVGGQRGAPAALWAPSLDEAPWARASAALAEAGLAAPLIAPLTEGAAPLGLLVVLPPAQPDETGSAPPTPGGQLVTADWLVPWATVAGLALARAADQRRLRGAELDADEFGLVSRTVLMACLRESLHAHPRRAVALIHVQLTGMEPIEERLPGADGDLALREVGVRLSQVVRPGDVVGRLRGASVAVVCEGVADDEPVEIARRIRDALEDPLAVEGRTVRCQPAVGVAARTESDTLNSLTHKAALAARDAATTRAGGVAEYRAGDREAAVARAGLESDLLTALAEGGLRLAYQPQVSLHDGSLIGAEALVRWDSPRGSIPPDEFIPVAEASGLIVDLGTWALDTAAAALASTIGAPVSVNVSARQLDDPRLVGVVTDALGRHGVEPSRLCLEITESALVRDLEASGAVLRQLRDLGVAIAIDDFGTGYASLEALRRYEAVDTLKIDRTFIRGIASDVRDRAIVAAAVTLGQALGFTVVAEGVESAEQADVLASLGCDAAQGYWYGEPLDADQLRRWSAPLG